MKRTEFDKKVKGKIPNLIGGAYLPKDVQLEYFKRLIKPYKRGNGEEDYFIAQYLQADGNELSKKFWSIHSSSRFAFELYSWMANDDEKEIQDICFEKKLDGLNGAEKKPNMDVYIETKGKVFFIESKFTESTPHSIDNLSEAYYCKKKDATNKRGLVVKKELKERYHDDEKACTGFPRFINKIKELLKGNQEKNSWMDYKQEITHLVGIYFTIRNDKNSYYRDKDICFLNVYYDFEDNHSDLTEKFFDMANDLMNGLLKGHCKSFEYRHLSAQELVKSDEIIKFDLDKPAFGLRDKKVKDMLNLYFEFESNL